jgi:hypothetical protein
MIGNNIPVFSGPLYFRNASNFNLQPEKAVAFDLGTDLRLRHNMMLSFDLFQANLQGQLYEYPAFDGTYNDGVHGTLPLFTNQFVNLSASRYQGLAVDLRRDAPLGFSWDVAGGLTRGYVISVPPAIYSNLVGPACNLTTGANCVNLTLVPGINFNGAFIAGAGGGSSGAVPYAQAHGSLSYTWNTGRSVGLNVTYYGNNNSFYRSPFITLDGNVTYPVTKHVALALNFSNITGIYDGGIQAFGPANFTAAPVLAGLPYPLYAGEVGPRTAKLTLNVSL